MFKGAWGKLEPKKLLAETIMDKIFDRNPTFYLKLCTKFNFYFSAEFC